MDDGQRRPIPFDYLFINVGAAVSVSLLYGICRAGVRSREQFERSKAAQEQAARDHAEALMAGRRQITRDLHDVIAHDVTVIALQADAALSGSDAGFAQSLEAIGMRPIIADRSSVDDAGALTGCGRRGRSHGLLPDARH